LQRLAFHLSLDERLERDHVTDSVAFGYLDQCLRVQQRRDRFEVLGEADAMLKDVGRISVDLDSRSNDSIGQKDDDGHYNEKEHCVSNPPQDHALAPYVGSNV
jgi:hypothetical protein